MLCFLFQMFQMDTTQTLIHNSYYGTITNIPLLVCGNPTRPQQIVVYTPKKVKTVANITLSVYSRWCLPLEEVRPYCRKGYSLFISDDFVFSCVCFGLMLNTYTRNKLVTRTGWRKARLTKANFLLQQFRTIRIL